MVYADDGNCLGKLSLELRWAQMVYEEGKKYGYYINPDKCIIVVARGSREEKIEEVKAALRNIPFEDAAVVPGAVTLGSYCGEGAGREEYVKEKVQAQVSASKYISIYLSIYL